MALTAASLASITAARAQSFTWGGIGSTTTTADYRLGTNWSNPPTGAPPVASGQSVVFNNLVQGIIPGAPSASVTVTGGSIAPDSWTFNTNSQYYLINGAAINFSKAGSSGGIINNASSGQAIWIANNIGESVAGVQVQQLGNSTMVLLGTNTYTGGTIIDAGVLQLGALTAKASIVGAVVNAGVFSLVDANTTGITSITNNGGLTTFLNATSASTANINNLGGSTVFGVSAGSDIATAGNATIISTGMTTFYAMTTAGSATIANSAGGVAVFADNSSAGNATIVNKLNGFTYFTGHANADNANITNMSGSTTSFNDNSSAGNSIITNNGVGVFLSPNLVSYRRALPAPLRSSTTMG